MKQTLSFCYCLCFSLSIAAQSDTATILLSAKALSGIPTISGSLAKPLATAMDVATAPDSATYSRLIGFKLMQGNNETISLFIPL